ncbi:helix-turn-helix domain-containing protein [Streptomyces sp. DSM 42041]|uniref:Helix-turn-helix domain-containing protein n=1 Tax=Streptomyces hazeniae TaxID=3075538 RepID=A0ABU2NZ97_9ACTN|nr:helix-turn-helix domain-containing protein [Streptomyces sp. DSM 42041]MDT0382304.1 helix-turn-helix domain-containing protein [Streptomyces sp. DSM 42041]
MATTGLPPAIATDLARVTETLAMITPRWHVRLLPALADRALRYSEIAEALPWLHDGQLHPKLRALCETGLADRTEHSARHVIYGLTQRGQHLLQVLPAIASWAEEHLEEPETPLTATEQAEDGLALLNRKQTPATLWALKMHGEANAPALAKVLGPGRAPSTLYRELRLLTEDGLVKAAGAADRAAPYRLTAAGASLGGVFHSLSTWAAGRPSAEAGWHPVWGRTDRGTASRSTPSRHNRRPLPAQKPPGTSPAYRPAWNSGELFSHTGPARAKVGAATGGVRR